MFQSKSTTRQLTDKLSDAFDHRSRTEKLADAVKGAFTSSPQEKAAEEASERASEARKKAEKAGKKTSKRVAETREKAGKKAEEAAESTRETGSSVAGVFAGLVPSIAAATAGLRQETAHGISEGVDSGAASLSEQIDEAPEAVDQARDWIVEDLLPKLQQMVDSTVQAKNEAADSDGSLSALAGETVQERPKKGGFLMFVGLALLGAAGYFWYTDQQRRQGDPWKKVVTTDSDPWAAPADRTTPAATLAPAETAPRTTATVAETPADTSAAAGTTGAAAGVSGSSATPSAPLATDLTPEHYDTSEDATRGGAAWDAASGTPAAAGQDPAASGGDAAATRTPRFDTDRDHTGPLAVGHTDTARDLAGDDAPTQGIRTVQADADGDGRVDDPYAAPMVAADGDTRDAVASAGVGNSPEFEPSGKKLPYEGADRLLDEDEKQEGTLQEGDASTWKREGLDDGSGAPTGAGPSGSTNPRGPLNEKVDEETGEDFGRTTRN